MFHGFSKMLIALGLEPDHMDTTVVPTPAPPDDQLDVELDVDDPHLALLSARPDLAVRWADMARKLAALDGPEAPPLAARARIAQLLGVAWGPAAPASEDPAVALAVELAELFIIDVRAITGDHLAAYGEATGPSGLVQLFMALAVYDGIYRMAACSAAQ